MIVFLFLLWVIFNGKVTVEILLFGAGICLLLSIFLKKAMDYGVKEEMAVWGAIPRVIAYIGLLVWEILKANWDVIKTILSRDAEISPKIVFFTPPVTSTPARVTLANSITLTPGTITVQLKNGRFCVHGLRKELTEGLDESSFVKAISKLEKKGAGK